MFRDIMDVLGISKLSLSKIDRASEDSITQYMARSINVSGMSSSLETLKQYVYGSKMIEEVIQVI